MKSRDFLNEIKDLGYDALRERAHQASEELMKLRFRKASGQLQQTHRLRELQRNIARLLTAMNAARAKGSLSAEKAAE